jgi:signal transduction histidine kinase
MKQALRKLVLLVVALFILSPSQVWAQSPGLVISDFHGDEALTEYIEWQVQPEGITTANWQQAAQWQGWQPLERPQIGFYHQALWTRLTLENPSEQAKTFLLYNPHAHIENLHSYLVFESPNGDIKVKEYQLGMLHPVLEQPIPHRLSTLLFTLPPQHTLRVYSRIQSLGSLNVTWHLADPQTFSRKRVPETLILGIFGGLIICLVIYNLLVIRRINETIRWSYIGFALFSLYYQYAFKGVFRFEPFGIDPAVFTLSAIVVPFAILFMLTLFSIQLFNTKTHLPKTHRFLVAMLVIYCLSFLYYLTGYLFDLPKQTSEIGLGIAFVGSIIPFFVGLLAVAKHLPGSNYYLAGQTVLMSGHLILIAALVGWLPNNTFTAYAIPLAILLDILLLAMAFSQRVAKMQQEYQRQRQMVIAQSRFSLMGQTFGSIAHEWRVPLVRLGSQLTELETLLWHKTTNLEKDLVDSLLKKMHVSLQTLVDTVSRFREFFRVDGAPERFNINEQVKQVINLLKGKQAWSMTQLEVSAREELEILNYPSNFSQVMMLLFDRTLTLCAQSETKKPVLVLHIFQPDKYSVELRLRIPHPPGLHIDLDNELQNLELSTAQILVEDKLQGQMQAQLLDDEIDIQIRLPLKLQGAL